MREFPEFIDNQDGNTLARALAGVLGENLILEQSNTAKPPDSVCIATAFFSPTGFNQISKVLEPVPVIRLMLGTDLGADSFAERKQVDETQNTFERRRLRNGLHRLDKALQRERDNLPFTRSSEITLNRLVSWLSLGNLEIRRYENDFLHAKAYIITSENREPSQAEGIIVGSSNLTGAGLAKNLELNIGRSDVPIVKRAQAWFDNLWDDALPYDVVTIFKKVLQPVRPWEIFLRVLWQLYGREILEDQKIDDDLPLTSFQKHGVARALRLIQEIGGVIVADEVGLGKTFIAGEILRQYLNRRQRTLLICPASLRDSIWNQFLNEYQLFVECLSFEQLANEKQLQDSQRPDATGEHLNSNVGEYQLVIVDEAHNYRNPNTPHRAAVLRRLMSGQKRDLLLLTATPVNNSLWDLYHLLSYFVRQDAKLVKRGIRSIRRRFEMAMREDPASLNPDLLYPVIDATTVKRTRQFVKQHYTGDTITGLDGRNIPIIFPKPVAISIRYHLDDLLPNFFSQLERSLDSDNDDALEFARYAPDTFLLDSVDKDETARSRATMALLRSGLLKRFESSVHAFRKTVNRMVSEHEAFLSALDSGYVVTTAFMSELSADDDSIFEEVLSETNHRDDAIRYDVERLRWTVERDCQILQELAKLTATIPFGRDPKLRALSDALVKIVKQAENEATDSADQAQKRKVLVFSVFEDTVEWIRDFLNSEVDTRAELYHYRGRIAVASGSGKFSTEPREEVVRGFAPLTMSSTTTKPEDDRYDLLITTDVLAEGVNLQQCRHIINFDLPWNPMRLVQRHGRIDRINSPHKYVFMRTVFPVDQLDRLLNLRKRILDKLAMAAASVGVSSPIEDAAHGTQVFTETREEIEKLLNEDTSLFERGGTKSATQTGEEYRQTLRKALKEGEKIIDLPWKVGSRMIKGERRGVFFCAVVGNESKFERTYLRFVSGDRKWNPMSQIGAIERELGTCLRMIECTVQTEIWNTDILRDRVYDFWEVAREDILVDWMRETDPANLQPAVQPLNHRVAYHIRSKLPSDHSDDRLKHALDILESPWPRRQAVLLRDWFQHSGYEGKELSQFLIDKIVKTGLEPAEPPEPLPHVNLEDVELLCWMGIESQDNSQMSA